MIKKIKFIKSAEYEKDFPESKLDIAMVGKSNVGKSSLINKITNNRKIARVSKSPGCTAYVNFFLANDSFYIVDLPGYGFAKVPNRIRQKWKVVVEGYLKTDRVKLVLLLVDVARDLDSDAEQMIEWLEYYNIEYRVIYTKIDKLKRNDLRRKRLEKKGIYISSKSGEGQEDLEEVIESFITANK